MLEMQQNSRQVPKVKEICASKQYYDIMYSYLQTISLKDGDSSRYFLKKDINFSRLGEMFGITRQTASTKFKNLIKLGLVVDSDAMKYELKELPKDYASLIPFSTLKVLVDALSENAISTYVYFLNLYYANDCKPFRFTISQVKNQIGVSANTRSNDDIVTNILFVLKKIGLIDYELRGEVQEDTSFKNIKTIYWITALTNSLEKPVG